MTGPAGSRAGTRAGSPLVGRTFMHPALDYLLIGGGLSVLVLGGLFLHSGGTSIVGPAYLPFFMLLANVTHFAASTTRLYTKPGARQALPFLSMGLPLVTLAVLTVGIASPGLLGTHIQSLYLTWSPYHYAAQAYGLAVMYCYRTGCKLSASNKTLLWWCSMAPFAYNFLSASGVGLHWILPDAWAGEGTALGSVAARTAIPLGLIAFAAPLFLFFKVKKQDGAPIPLISLLVLVVNAIWWFLLLPMDAFVWATIFHSVQYLAIVVIFHVKEQTSRPGNRRGAAYHAIWFYVASAILGYVLFQCLPRAYTLAGFGMVESALLVIAVINIHHFVVDGYIWRLKPSDGNRRIVESQPA